MTVFSEYMGAITGGTVAGTYGTAVSKQLAANAKDLIALLVFAAMPTYTTAEGKACMLRLNSDDLGIVNQVFMVGPYNTSGPATNSGGDPGSFDIIQLDYDLKGAKPTLAIDVAPQGASTAGALYEIGVLYSDGGGLPSMWGTRFPDIIPVKGGGMVGAQQLTVTRTALTAITVPKWAKAIVGVKPVAIKTGAITAGEEVLGYFDLESTIPNIAPQKYPVVIGQGAPLGTPVDHIRLEPRQYIPTYIPKGDMAETVTPYINLRTAVTTDCRVALALVWV